MCTCHKIVLIRCDSGGWWSRAMRRDRVVVSAASVVQRFGSCLGLVFFVRILLVSFRTVRVDVLCNSCRQRCSQRVAKNRWSVKYFRFVASWVIVCKCTRLCWSLKNLWECNLTDLVQLKRDSYGDKFSTTTSVKVPCWDKYIYFW